MTPEKSARCSWLITGGAIAAIGLSMITAFSLTLALYPDAWVPAEAEVIVTRVESSREGSLIWTLNADIAYEIGGKRYQSYDFKILHESLRADTVRRQREWPAGKRFTVYVNSSNPDVSSLYPDGGREALAVTLAVLTPAFLMVVAYPFVLLAKRLRRS